MQLRDVRGRVSVITGASSGIGEAAARVLAEAGVRVVLVARSRGKIEALASELGEGCVACAADVGDPAQVGAVFDLVRERFGGIDLLFNNAGVGYHGAFADSDPAQWRAMIDANLYGVLHCTKAAIPLMRGRDGAMISTVSSVGGRHGIEGWSVYNATKFGVVGFHDALRKELGPQGIRVSLIEPGAVFTQWGHNVPVEAMRERREKLQALHAQDIANALLYAYAQPANVNVQELLIMPTRQTYP